MLLYKLLYRIISKVGCRRAGPVGAGRPPAVSRDARAGAARGPERPAKKKDQALIKQIKQPILTRTISDQMLIEAMSSAARGPTAEPIELLGSKKGEVFLGTVIIAIIISRRELRERGSAPGRGRHSTICFLPPHASVQWQPDGLAIHANK